MRRNHASISGTSKSHSGRKNIKHPVVSAVASKKSCDFCGGEGHDAPRCYLNTESHSNRLTTQLKQKFAMVASTGKMDSDSSMKKKKSKSKKVEMIGVATIMDSQVLRRCHRPDVDVPADQHVATSASAAFVKYNLHPHRQWSIIPHVHSPRAF